MLGILRLAALSYAIFEAGQPQKAFSFALKIQGSSKMLPFLVCPGMDNS